MSLTTYGGLKTAVASWATRSDLTDQMDDFCIWAHQEIKRRLRANVLLATADLTVSTEIVAQPTGFLALKRLYLDVSPRVTLSVISAEMASDRCAQYGTGTYPDSVAVMGANLHFAPLFSTETTGKALYYEAPTLMSADADHNVVMDAYPMLYLFGALEALFNYVEDDNNADRYGGKFGALIEDINGRDAADTMSGPLRSMPFGGGII